MLPPELGLGTNSGAVIPAGFFQGSDCDAMPGMGCDSCGGCDGAGGCNGGCGGGGGLLGKVRGGGGLLGRSGGKACLFCRGAGCSVCMSYGNGQIVGGMMAMLGALRPYSEASLCNQRWYDFSAEATFLSRSIGGGSGGVFTTRGIEGTPVLTDDSVGSDDLEAGVRLSGAFIFGAGGNLEVTYMGGQEWTGSATVTGNEDLFSYISNFGTLPGAPLAPGFDDTDRSLSQTLSVSSEFHSGEVNYRRRTMMPYCRFQGSWLVGLRHVRYDESQIYSATGTLNNALAALPRFFSSDSTVKNNFFGPQMGFDLWWNIVPGVSLGTGAKGAWVQNNIDRRISLSGNSLGPGATPGNQVLSGGGDDVTVMADFELKMVYRLSHSWTFRSAYYGMVIDDYAFQALSQEQTRTFLTTTNTSLGQLDYDSLVVQGFSFGAEYMW